MKKTKDKIWNKLHVNFLIILRIIHAVLQMYFIKHENILT
jgi:hypothetical protein